VFSNRRSRMKLAGFLMVVVVGAAAAVAAVAGTASAGGAGGSVPRIVFVSGPLTDSFFPPLYNGAKQAAHDLGIKFNYIPINEADIEQSSAQTMQAAIAQHPDALVVGDFVTPVVDPLIKQAIKKGIPVYVDQSGQDQWQADGAFGFIGQQGPATGQAGGRELIKDGVKHALCVNNVPGNPYLTKICMGLAAAMKAAGGDSVMLPLPTADSTDPQKVTQDIGAFLASHKSIQGILCENAAVGSDAVTAAQQANRKVHIGTLALSKQTISQLQSGQLDFLINEQPYLDGYLGMLFAYTYAKYGLSPIGAVATGPAIVDKSNLAKILSVVKKYPGVLGST